MLEAERERLLLHRGELVGVHVALDGQVRRGRTEVLADREDVAVDRAEVAERLAELLARENRVEEGRALLADVASRFTQGQGTPVLRSANAFLVRLAATTAT